MSFMTSIWWPLHIILEDVTYICIFIPILQDWYLNGKDNLEKYFRSTNIVNSKNQLYDGGFIQEDNVIGR